jgi:hypothetical protein
VTSRKALARHPVAIAGAAITTVAAVVFVALLIAAMTGLFANPYAGLVVFVAIPLIFFAGLLLIPLGMWLQRRNLARHPDVVVEDWPVVDFRRPHIRRTALVISILTAANLVILLLAGYGSLHWMESPTFCGQACHVPMQPQFSAWQVAAHGRVPCVKCHIGEGAAAFAHAKLSGVRQLVHVTTGSYPTPIPPGARMDPGAQAQTCTNCHQPESIRGDRVRVMREYADDEASTQTTTVLQMHVGSSIASERAIHWHANPANRVEYVATDAERQTIPYVKVTDAKGTVTEYVAPDVSADVIRAGTRRIMDCVDCHNTVGHPISPTAEQAVDRALASALVSRQLPFVRREGVRLVKAPYPSQDAAAAAIDRDLRRFYQSQGETDDGDEIGRSVAALQEVYRRNVFPAMKVTWGTYPDNKGHLTSTGCFRCHDDSHQARDGSTISGDCEYCHKQVEPPSP